MKDITAFTVNTPHGSCFAVFPNKRGCELVGFNINAISYFEDNLIRFFLPHGHAVYLESITSKDFFTYCNRPDLCIQILKDVDRDELENQYF